MATANQNSSIGPSGISISIDQKAVDNLEKALKDIPWHIRMKERNRIQKRAARKVVKAARQKLKADNKVKTGTLAKSIGVITRLSEEGDIWVGPRYSGVHKAVYAHLVEFGFFHRRAKKFIPGTPFMRPAYESSKNEVIKEIISETKKLIDKAAAKAEIKTKR